MCQTWRESREESELHNKNVYLADINDITQIIDEPTRGTNLLDLIFTSYNKNIIMIIEIKNRIPWHLYFEESDNINDIVDNIT